MSQQLEVLSVSDTSNIDTRRAAIEVNFPIEEISKLAEHESWRKEVNRPIYHIHKWWATRLGSVFRAITIGTLSDEHSDIWQEFYRQQDFRGKVVLDPFMGSGTTLGEALKLGCKVVGTDINPVSTFLVQQSLTAVQISDIRAAYKRLEQEVADEIKQYYQTRDPETGELIPVLYYFWVKCVNTPDGECVPLFDKYVFSQDAYPKKKPKAQIVCPNCWTVIEDRYDATQVSCHECGTQFNPQVGPVSRQFVTSKSGSRCRIKDLIPKDGTLLQHKMYALLALRPNGDKVYLPISDFDLELLRRASKRLASEELPLPSMDVRPGHNTDQARGYNYLRWRDFFNDRQLLSLGLLLRSILAIDDSSVRNQMLCLFSSTLEFNNMFCSYKGEGTGAVRHMFSNHILKPERTPLENNVWGTGIGSGTFSSLFASRLIKAKQYLDSPFEIATDKVPAAIPVPSGKVTVSAPIQPKLVKSWKDFCLHQNCAYIMNEDGRNLPIPDKSVDAVITDPPYFDFVHYSELSDFFFAWLAPVLKNYLPYFDKANSSSVGEVQHKDALMFSQQLSNVFSECCRVLKDDGLLVFSFHHSRPEGWAAIRQAIVEAGLAVVSVHPVHAELRAASPKSAAKEPISLDAILVCRKRNNNLVHDCRYDLPLIRERISAYQTRLQQAGMKLSDADLFVIGAAELLIPLSNSKLTFETAEEVFEKLKKSLI